MPDCTCEKLTVLGERKPISGAGLALAQKGLTALLQPRVEKLRTIRQARETPPLQKRMGDHSFGWVPRRMLEQKHPGCRGRDLGFAMLQTERQSLSCPHPPFAHCFSRVDIALSPRTRVQTPLWWPIFTNMVLLGHHFS